VSNVRTAGRLYQVLADVLGVDPSSLTEEASPDTVAEWDSLNHLMVVNAVEGEFGVRISIDEAVAMRSVSAIRGLLHARGITG